MNNQLVATTGILLTGGQSTRMGQPKVNLPLGSETFGSKAIGLLQQFCNEILISQNAPLVTSDYQTIADNHPNIGPIGGIEACLKASANDWNLVIACDMPFLETSTIEMLFQNIDDSMAVCFRHHGFGEPLCALYHQSALTDIQASIAAGDYSLQQLLKKLKTRFIEADETVQHQLSNINSQDDFLKISHQLSINERLILISGTGRNSGKTTMACKIIEKLSANQPVIGIKISPHPHQNQTLEPLVTGNGFNIWLETTPPEGKDSWRMLQAGAEKVFYIESENSSLSQAFQEVEKLIHPNDILVCESGGLRHVIKPAVFLMATNPEQTPKSSSTMLLPLADAIFELNEILSPQFIEHPKLINNLTSFINKNCI
jgi:molybdopterin-guanine dinucleotide biosynthesis protein A